jgi:transposase
MPAATPIHIRRLIIGRREAGESYAAIGRELSVPYITVRKVYQHYQQTGQEEPSYERCRHSRVRKAEAIYQQAIALKGGHPGWGAGLIWVELAEQFDEQQLPSIRTLQRWFHRAKLTPRRRERQPAGQLARGEAVHQVWALDAKEQIQLQDGSYVSWLTISDEASGAVLEASLFPPETLDPSRSGGGEAAPANRSDPLGETKDHPHG